MAERSKTTRNVLMYFFLFTGRDQVVRKEKDQNHDRRTSDRCQGHPQGQSTSGRRVGIESFKGRGGGGGGGLGWLIEGAGGCVV